MASATRMMRNGLDSHSDLPDEVQRWQYDNLPVLGCGYHISVCGGTTKTACRGKHFIFEASSNGRTAGFDPAYRGSNPCASAKFMWASGEVGESQQTVNLSPIG